MLPPPPPPLQHHVEKPVTFCTGKLRNWKASFSQGPRANWDLSQATKMALFLPAVLRPRPRPRAFPTRDRTHNVCPAFQRWDCCKAYISCKSPNLAASKSQKAPHHAFSALPKKRALPSVILFRSQKRVCCCVGAGGGSGEQRGRATQSKPSLHPQEERCWLHALFPSIGRFFCLVLWFPEVGISEI